MLQIILSVLLAGVPRIPAITDEYHGSGAKIDPSQPPAVVIHPAVAGQGWRTAILSGEAHNNLLWIGPDSIAYIGAEASGSSVEGASVWYSFDNGQTWTKYNINSTISPNPRTYPDIWYDRDNGVIWYTYGVGNASGVLAVFAAKDEGFSLGAPGLFTEFQVTDYNNSFAPSIFAIGDTVVVSYTRSIGGVYRGLCKYSFDGGQTWSDEVVITPTYDLGIFYSSMIFVEPHYLVFYTTDYNDDESGLAFWKSEDWGQTWQGPYEVTSSAYTEFGFGNWWYNMAAVSFQNKAHVITVMSMPGYENGILFDYVFDPTDNSITEMYVHGVVVADTDSLGNVTYSAGIPQARTPGVGVTTDGNWLVAMFMDYDTLYRKDPYFMVFDGNHWYGTAVDDPSAFAVPVFAVADTFDEGRGDFCPTVYNDGDYLHFYFVCSSQSINYANVYFATNTRINPAVSESSTRPALALSVRPTVVTGNLNVEFAISKASNVEVSVYNVNGRKVATLFTGTLNAGSHRMTFPASFGRGIYFVNLTVDGKSTSRKVVVK